MKKVILLLLIANSVSAQIVQQKKVPHLRMGSLSYTEVNHVTMVKATVAEILAAPRLVMDPPEYTVASYEVSIVEDGKDNLLGPYLMKTPELTAEVQDVLRHKAGRHGTMHIESVSVLADGVLRNYNPMTIVYSW